MKYDKLKIIHPGEVLKEEFLKPMNISSYRLAKEIDVLKTRISQIIKGKRRITVDTVLRLAKCFGTTPRFWLGLQNDYDLEEKTLLAKESLDKIKKFA